VTTQRVDFYLLNRAVTDGKLRFACRLTRKALDQGNTAFIQTGDTDEAARLDDMLWTFDQGSFIPHRLAGDGDEPAPVLIGCEPPGERNPDVLIAVGGDPLAHFKSYSRVAEVVDATDEDKRAARQRYKAYREHGCELDTHPIDP
jgi:DNA polymerase-3 subunit chi